ncbi:hypothetical protein L1987_58578 [Smallanthus sonchifolius]|uniref:Uncharacterized protein n=1 Tax=Smallanthus sonchifolius TaxID=185202 RepID=A0ACB9DFL8_9ASTR|nr:hypothetical protein L1987_58578 [Smallanthus sonchifolius]
MEAQLQCLDHQIKVLKREILGNARADFRTEKSRRKLPNYVFTYVAMLKRQTAPTYSESGEVHVQDYDTKLAHHVNQTIGYLEENPFTASFNLIVDLNSFERNYRIEWLTDLANNLENVFLWFPLLSHNLTQIEKKMERDLYFCGNDRESKKNEIETTTVIWRKELKAVEVEFNFRQLQCLDHHIKVLKREILGNARADFRTEKSRRNLPNYVFTYVAMLKRQTAPTYSESGEVVVAALCQEESVGWCC